MKRPQLSLKRRTSKSSVAKSSKSSKQSKQLPAGVPSGKQIAIELVVVFSVIILGVGTFLWWHYIASNPKRVFTGMLNNALQTSTGAVRIVQSQGDQTLDQNVQFSTTGQHVAYATTTLTQGNSLAKTETIGTPSLDYVRYTAIESSQLSASGKPLDFSKSLNVWGKSLATADATQTNGQLYNQVVLGVIPFGNLPLAQRQQLLKDMQSAYIPDYANITRTIVHGRPVYSYRIQIMPEPYVVMLKEYARFSGLTQLESLDPSTYSSASALVFNVTVDVWSRQLTTITYGNSNRVEQFSQFGLVLPPLNIPTNSIPINELESRLQSIQ